MRNIDKSRLVICECTEHREKQERHYESSSSMERLETELWDTTNTFSVTGGTKWEGITTRNAGNYYQ